MAFERTRKRDIGDRFPDLRMSLVEGGEIHLPVDSKGKWMVFLGCRGHWWQYCRRQLADFQDHLEEFEKRDILVIAGSAENREDSLKSKTLAHSAFPLGYGLNPKKFSRKTGAYFDDKQRFIQVTDFIIDPDGIIRGCVYSSGGIGGYTAVEVLERLDQLMQSGIQTAGSTTTEKRN